jgi:ribosomal RNA-processing protein 7
MSKISDFTLLPIALPPHPSFPTPATHTIYLRPNEPKIPTENDARSLFLVNIPVDSTAAHFRAIFASLVGVGRFESISFGDEKKSSTITFDYKMRATGGNKKKRKRVSELAREAEEGEELPRIWDRELHRSGSTAVVVLVDAKSVDSVFKSIRRLHKGGKEAEWPVWGEGIEGKVPKLGSARYATQQKLRYPDTKELQRSVDAFMEKFGSEEEERAREAKRARNVPDEDGFVTVTRGGRVGPARMEEAERKRLEMEEKDRNKRESMSDFYRFQMRERRKAEQGELVKRFEEDKKRVEVMREKRGRFRPEK